MQSDIHTTPDILALGEPLVEFCAAEAGPLAEVSHFTAGCGGDTSNFAVAVSRLGGRAGYISRVGNDPFADLLIKCWQTEGVDYSFVTRDDDAPTGLYFTSREGDQHHFTYYRRNSAASRMQPSDLPLGYIRKAKWLHVSGISLAISTSAAETVVVAVAKARRAGVRVSCDPNLRLQLWPLEKARDAIHRLVAHTDILFPSYEDAGRLTGLSDPEAIVHYYLAMGPKVVVLKMGAKGALLAEASSGGETQRKILRYQAYPVAAIDASGAGDTFDAAFAVAYMEGQSLSDCVQFANAAGALVTTGVGAVTPIPRRAAVQRLMNGTT